MKILLPLDGSTVSESALPWVEALAKHLKSSVLLVQVVDPFVPGPAGFTPSLTLRLTELHQGEVKACLQEQVSRFPDTVCEWQCLMGSPQRLLGSLAQPEHCQAVIMASHGRSGGARWLMGSVAESVLRQSTVPVLLLRPNSTGTPGCFRRVLVPLDGSPESQAFLPYLKPWLASNAEVTLLRASGLNAHDYTNVVDPEAHQKFLQQMDDELAEVGVDGIEFSRLAVEGVPAERIVALAQEGDYDLVALSTHGRSGWQRFVLGSVTEKVVRQAHCPVLVFPQRQVEP